MLQTYFEAMKLIQKHPEGRATLKRFMNKEGSIGLRWVIFILAVNIMCDPVLIPFLVYCCYSPRILKGLTFAGELILIIVTGVAVYALLLVTISIVDCFIRYLNFTIPNTLHELRSETLIPANHGDSIGEIIVQLRNQPVEYDVIFDNSGGKLGEWTYFDSRNCGAPSNIDATGGICIHNHPTRFGAVFSPNYGVAFSPDDFGSAAIQGLHKSIVVACDAIYTLEGFDEVEDEINSSQIWEEAQQVLSALYATMGALYPTGGRRYSLAVYTAWCGACQAIAERYGLKFTAERFRDSDYVKAYRNSLRSKSRTYMSDQTAKEKV